MGRKIVLQNIQKPSKPNLKEDINWLGDSFGFTNGRDIEKSSNKLLNCILQEISNNGSVTSEKLSYELDFAVQRVNYHLKSLIEAGFLYRDKNKIFLREGSAKAAVEEMRKDANRLFDNLAGMAEEIDLELGLKSR